MGLHRSATARPLHLTILLAIVLWTLVGCGKPPPPLTQPQRIEQIHRDFAPLQGRRIVVDPGHGGRFSGAIGSRGLRESDVNLAVGLHLWGLLNEAGAKVWLTRTADTDLVPSPSGSLKDDLNARAQLSNDVTAELFISIHHNSNIRDPNKNNLQVYYKLSDPGPSHDLALSLADTLGKNFLPDHVFVLPGNYRVLRETHSIAVLGEASFLSHRQSEERLSISNQLRREAEDYFAGILAYCRKGTPQVVELRPDKAMLENAFPTIEARIIGGPEGRAIDPHTTAIILDGHRVPTTFDPATGRLVHIPKTPLLNGDHTFSVTARNRNGNAVHPNLARFGIAVPLQHLHVSSAFSHLPLDVEASTRILVHAADRHGNPVIDGTEITLSASGGRLDRETIRTEAGKGIAYFSPPAGAEDVEVIAIGKGVSAGTTVRCGTIDHGLARVNITDAAHTPLGGVELSTGGAALETSDQNGFAFLQTPNTGELLVTLLKPGFPGSEALISFKQGTFRSQTVSLAPLAGGAFLNRIITIDPESWDERFSPEKGLAAEAVGMNIAVALQIQELLHEAGAGTILTRQSLQEEPTLGDRLRAGEQRGSDYFVTVTHRSNKPSVAHYFNSALGKKLAQHLAAAMEKECNLKSVAVQDAADFTIIHPSCPAVVVNFGFRKQVRKETATSEAQAVYEGLASFLAGADTQTE